MKKLFFLFFCLLPFALYLSSCHCKKNTTPVSKTTVVEQKMDFETEGYVKATVINYEVDGCTFLLKLMDEKKLEATKNSSDFKKD